MNWPQALNSNRVKLMPFMLCLCILSLSCFTASAQFRNGRFGKNRVQYKNKEWNYVSTTNFDIYFYDGGYDIARLAAQFAEEDFDRITDMVGFSPYNKTKILIYNSIIDLHQSNIGIYYQGYEVGGQTRFIRSEVEVAFTGNKANFKNELAVSIADILIFEMMYGGTLKEIFQSSFLLNLPEWFLAGAASYIADGWSVEMDDYMRDMLNRKKFKRPRTLEGEEARLVGQSIWNYIAEEYGKSNIANVLNLTRIVRNEESSINNTLGVSFKTFMKGWQAYYTKQYGTTKDSHELPPEDSRFTKKNRKNLIYNEVSISPSGRYIAYTQNNRGRWKVKVYDKNEDKTKTVLKGGYKLINQKVDESAPLLAWRDKAELGAFNAKDGKLYLWFYELGKRRGNKRKEKRVFRSFSNINDFDISVDGNYLALSAEWRGKNNLYYYDYRNRKLTQLTNDIYDDMSPRFMPGRERKIIFSSNRKSDTLSVMKETNSEDITNNFNIFIYDFQQNSVLRRVSNTLSRDVRPVPINKNEILYLSDQRGISHLYKYNLRDSISTQLTNYNVSIHNYDYNKGEVMAVMLDDGTDKIYQLSDFNTDKPVFTGKTYRQQLKDLRLLQAMKKKREEEERAKKLAEEQERKIQEQQRMLEEIRRTTRAYQASLNNLIKAVDSLQSDSLISQLPDSSQVAAALADSLLNNAQDTAVVQKDEDEEINTDDYQFDTFSKGKRRRFVEKYQQKTQQQQEEEKKDELKVSRSRPYERMFAADNFTTSLLIDPLRGWGLLFKVAMTDVLENHKINAGMFFVSNLNNSNLFAEYEFLKHRLDYRARYERRNLEIQAEAFSHRYYINFLEGSVSYPFNITSRVSVEPFFASTRYTNTSISNLNNNFIPDEVINYAGFSTEFVFDNSIVTGMNMMQGTRLKIRYENYNGLNSQNKGFGEIMFDIRNYQKIHKSLIFATRLSYGKFLGQDPKRFILGGMDNWVFNQTDDGASGDPLAITQSNNSDLLFHKFITPLRGFNYNKLFGENYMLFNAELRFPVLKYFAKGTITSNFFRNLQLVGFTDIGSAWTGVSPFRRENSLNTEIIESGSFEARVSNFKNPFLVGYGAGIRTMLLGYYTKLDVAWGLEDNVLQDAKFYLTIGYDF